MLNNFAEAEKTTSSRPYDDNNKVETLHTSIFAGNEEDKDIVHENYKSSVRSFVLWVRPFSL